MPSLWQNQTIRDITGAVQSIWENWFLPLKKDWSNWQILSKDLCSLPHPWKVGASNFMYPATLTWLTQITWLTIKLNHCLQRSPTCCIPFRPECWFNFLTNDWYSMIVGSFKRLTYCWETWNRGNTESSYSHRWPEFLMFWKLFWITMVTDTCD